MENFYFSSSYDPSINCSAYVLQLYTFYKCLLFSISHLKRHPWNPRSSNSDNKNYNSRLTNKYNALPQLKAKFSLVKYP